MTIVCQDSQWTGIQAVVFDKDGTLADSISFLHQLAIARSQCLEARVPGTGQALLTAFGCMAQRCDPQGLMAVGTRYENEIAAATYVAAQGYAWGEAVRLAQEACQSADQQFTRKAIATPPLPATLSLLQSLHHQGLKLAVLSGDTTANVEDFVAYHGMGDWVNWCAGSEKPPFKPDPEMLWQACRALQVRPEQCLVIGDASSDQQLAEQGRARAFVSVTWGGSPPVVGADAIAHHPQDLRVVSP